MKNEDILDVNSDGNTESNIKTEQKKYFKLVLFFIVVNTLFFTFIMKGPRGALGNFTAALTTNLLAINILGFVIGLLLATFPYKGLTFQKKYLRSSLLVILCLHGLMCFSLLLIGLMRLLGWY